ncbi:MULTISPECIES: co-chaperone YbbN [Anoxybacillus]|uniref:Thiol-disulfide isomerase n=1 Tax=Anoxybacillus flavithermus AK1 TaxID=1297581 RepID=M8D233_9BACL|nr:MULTISPECIES: thioredoxin family protein [Anoxybacillus]EMT44932.1 thiol-disulfide isomerase [Anoxybacillus flavithermus AK1]MBW7650922.1 thioredoxin family protein [Anoxybacillus sp. ST4]
MKKLLIFGGVIIALFIALAWITSYTQKQKVEGNPFGKEELHPATIDLLDDPNYKNIILPDELREALNNKETMTIYFYSSTCEFCKKTTPIVVPLAKEMGIDLKQFNLLEFDEGWNEYRIEATPTIVHFQNGKEVARIEGYYEEDVFRQWFEQIK